MKIKANPMNKTINTEFNDKPSIKWEGDNETELLEFAGDAISFDDDPSPDFVTVKTKDGYAKADLGDSIVRNNDGTFSVIKD